MKRNRVGRPAAKYSQTERALALYMRLQAGEVVQPASVAAGLRVDKRTVQRDIAALSEFLAGQLEEVTEGPQLGWRLKRTPQPAHDQPVTKWQVLGLSLGMQLIQFLSGRELEGQVRPLLSELRARLPIGKQFDAQALEQKLHVVESGQKLYRENPQALRMLDEMLDGLLLDQPIDLQYLSPTRKAAGASPRAMRVHALCMTVHRGAVYFVVDAGDNTPHSATRIILLSLDRIRAVRVDRTAQCRARPRGFRAAEYFRSAFGVWTGPASHHVQLHIDREYADAVRERTWHSTQQSENLTDGSLRLSMTLGSLEEVADWVLGMGEHVRVEGPQALIDRVKLRLQRALAHYS